MSTAHPFLPLSLDDEIAEENWEQFENEYKTRYRITEKGGRGSGFFSEEGHVGIPGHQGGRAHEGSGVSNVYSSYQLYFEGQKDPEPVKKLGNPEKYISFLGDVTEEQKEKSLKYIKAWNDEIKKQTGIDVSDISTNIVI